jgi:hypothetical protein
MPRPLKTLGWVLMGLLAAAGLYGFFHEGLWAESLWSADGRERFLAYAAVYWALAGVILWRCPQWLRFIVPAAALIYTAWWTGPVAPLSVMYFLGSCYFLGRIVRREKDACMATLLGAAVWMFVIWIALHFPINTRAVYAVAFALPYLLAYRELLSIRIRAATVMERSEACALALLLFILIAHLLAALKPETSADGLSMHLALPMAVARDAQWAFDFRLNSWALMPNAADGMYAAMYVLGGEHAAHVLNFSFLVLICLLIASAARRYAFQRVSPPMAWLIAALFASTPLVQLVTGSLFVENVWAAMILAATLALLRSDVVTAAVFVGSALAVKVIAGAFAVPIAIIAFAVVLRKRQWTRAMATAAFLILFAAPPYIYAYAKTGNPVFPFANAKFKSPDFDTEKSFVDLRFTTPISSSVPYDITFQSKKFLEAQGGASGFQYFLLLAPALLWTRRKEQWTTVAIAGIASVIILYEVPYLRYLYPVLPLASIAIAWLAAEIPPAAGTTGLILLTALNLWFLPSSGYSNQDFALFRHADIRPYLERTSPVRMLIEDLNHRAPGEPVAFFSTADAGDLNGPAYTDTWHSERYWSRLKAAQDPREIAVMLDRMGIHYVVAPASQRSDLRPILRFLKLWIDPVRAPIGPLGLFRLKDVNAPPDTAPIPPGRYDDLDAHIEYAGPWHLDLQFPESSDASLTYSDTPGASFSVTFNGRGITYVYTQAFNRGIAEVTIDGGPKVRFNQYSIDTHWQATHQFDGLKPGVHTMEVRVSGEKDPRSNGLFVDLDAFVVEP